MMRKIKKLLFKNKFVYDLLRHIVGIFYVIAGKKNFAIGGVKIVNKGNARIRKQVAGSGNVVIIGEDAYLFDVNIRIRGNDNRIIIGENVSLGTGSSFWVEGNGVEIIIGDSCTFTHTVEFAAQEDGRKILIGKDCMFSNNIKVRTSDSHPIIDRESGKRINFAKDVYIGNHVWIAPNTTVMKGAYIEDGAIIGSDTMVNSFIGHNCLAVGHPAIVKKENVEWGRDSVLGNIPNLI